MTAETQKLCDDLKRAESSTGWLVVTGIVLALPTAGHSLLEFIPAVATHKTAKDLRRQLGDTRC